MGEKSENISSAITNTTLSSPLSIDQRSGFDYETKIYHSLRPHAPLPSDQTPLSVTDYVFDIFHQIPTTTTASLIDAATHHRIPLPEVESYAGILAASLQHRIGLSKGDSAFLLSPNSVHIPILYLSLFSLGVIISPSNPASSIPEISRQIQLSKPVIAFATSDTAHKLPSLRHRVILLDSPEFHSLMTVKTKNLRRVGVTQSDTAAILYSSGTTGKVKGVALTHRNLISTLAGAKAVRPVRSSAAVAMCTVPYFHVYGFVYCVRAVALGESLVSMKRFDLRLMMRAIEEFRVSHVALAPPVVVAMVNNSLDDGYDLSYLEFAFSGGAPLTNALIGRFKTRFPSTALVQAYGMTETAGGFARTIGPYESKKLGATGRLAWNCQAKIVDPDTGIGLPPFKHGELWVRGPFIMKGYVNDEEATTTMLNSDGWLRTGDLCYFDNEGFLFYVDRIKELIKCNGYQVPPAELEQLLQSHADIVDAAVIPYPDDKAGQVPIAYVVRRLGSTIDESLIKDFVAKEVSPYKKLRRVYFIDFIPKNAPGKVLKKELIRMAISSAASKL